MNSFRPTRFLAIPTAIGLGVIACREKETAVLPPNPSPAPQQPKTDSAGANTSQGLKHFFNPRKGETWSYQVHRDLPPDSLLDDDDQLRSSDLPGGGFRFTDERRRVCLGTRLVADLDRPLTVFELSDNGIPSGLEYVDIGPDGLVARAWQQAGTEDRTVRLLDPGILLAAPGLAGGQSWESTDGAPGQPIQFRVIERTELTVPAGTYETVRIQMNTGNDARGVRRTLWFAENVGIVQEETIHYTEHRITVREFATLTAWTIPSDEEKPGEPEREEHLTVVPPPPDIVPPPEDLPEPPDPDESAIPEPAAADGEDGPAADDDDPPPAPSD